MRSMNANANRRVRFVMSTLRRSSIGHRRGAISASPYYLAAKRGYRYSRQSRSQKSNEEEIKEEHGLTSTQIEAFREVFNLFDVNGGGTIDADELNSALKSVEIQLTHQEIHDVLQVIDEDGNGEIDFLEFLSLMTSTEKYLETVRSVTQSGEISGEKKENLLFSALTKFMRKSALSSLSEIERYYGNKVRKSPHVVGHYAAGARLIGLTEKQMAKHWATLKITGDKNIDSPYAQPVCLFIPGTFPKYLPHSKNRGKIKLTVTKKYLDIDPDKNEVEADQELADCSLSQNPSISSSKLPSLTDNYKGNSLKSSIKKKESKSCPSRLNIQVVPLPTVKATHKKLTIEHLPMIRREVSVAFETFRKRREAVQDMARSKHCTNFTDLSVIPSRSLQIQYKRILEAYNFKPTQIPTDLLDKSNHWQLTLAF